MRIEFKRPHKYTLDDSPIPSVTTILKVILGNQFDGIDPIYMQRGSAAHALYELLGRGIDLNEYDYDHRLDGFVRGWRDWYRTLSPEIIGTVMRVGSRVHRYAGTLDLLCVLSGETTVVDYKATATSRDKYQLAAYTAALTETEGINATQAVSVEIKPNGKWSMGKILSGARLRQAKNEWVIIRKAAEIKERLEK